jgi:hypothetical protein
VSQGLAGRPRRELAHLAREWLLAGHLIDRAGMPQVISELGRDEMTAVAIAEWRGASPVYTRRMQRALRFEGDDVATIFKGMQLDIGAPPGFMDFRYQVDDEHHGGFHLAHCGALIDVEPMGDTYVTAMCHHIEDPTFDATAAATNPRARMRPVHRPPRSPADRHPHCAWRVEIDPDADPLPEPDEAVALSTSRAATVELTPIDPGDEGRDHYAGALEPDLVLEEFSASALVRILEEVALQGHLLARGFLLAVAERAGPDVAVALGAKQLTGIAGLVARRLCPLAGTISGSGGLDGLRHVLEIHPALHPAPYVTVSVDAHADALALTLGVAEALADGDDLSWPGILALGHDGPLEAIAQAVEPTARIRRVEAPPGELRWEATLATGDPPAPEPPEVTLAAFSTGATFSFDRR